MDGDRERGAGSRGSSARSGGGTGRSRSMPAANPSPPLHVPMPHTVVDGLDIEYASMAHLGGGAADYAMDYGLGYHYPLARLSMSGPEGEFDSARSRLPKANSQRGLGSMRNRSSRGAESDRSSERGPHGANSKSFKIDFTNSISTSQHVEASIKSMDQIPKNQKHVWDSWAPYRVKPRSKITWMRSIFYPNNSRPFPWKLMLLNALWTAIIVVLIEIPSVHLDRIIGYLKENSADIATFVGMCTFFLTIILSFRVNQAYNRWWEARTLWGGMTNDCRDLSLKSLTHVYNHNLAVKLCLWVTISADLLRNHLRGKRDLGLLNVLKRETEAVSPEDYRLIEKSNHRVLMCFWKLGRLLAESRARNAISPLMHMHLNEHIQKFNNHMGAMERILRCPMPIGYTCMIRTTIIFWMMILPFSLMPVFGYVSIPIDIIITWFICGLEETAAELENPFGVDPNDLPLEFFTTTIRNNIFEMLASYENDQLGCPVDLLFPAGAEGGESGRTITSPVEECATPLEQDYDSPTSEGIRSPAMKSPQ
mmetsp:Transcript_14370/g.36263  ORF Transcript_14370/g.36263 Transcript_14370/m.36263 type:complete len:537 (+) Transcript_14370:228-1838(+)